jgi:hypothetical protein
VAANAETRPTAIPMRTSFIVSRITIPMTFLRPAAALTIGTSTNCTSRYAALKAETARVTSYIYQVPSFLVVLRVKMSSSETER